MREKGAARCSEKHQTSDSRGNMRLSVRNGLVQLNVAPFQAHSVSQAIPLGGVPAHPL